MLRLRRATLWSSSIGTLDRYGLMSRPEHSHELARASRISTAPRVNSFNGDFNKAEMVKSFILSSEYSLAV